MAVVLERDNPSMLRRPSLVFDKNVYICTPGGGESF